MSRSAVFYHYFGLNEEYVRNLKFFLSCGINAHSDYFVLASSPVPFPFPEWPNLRLIDVPNCNHDYGGYCRILQDGKLVGSYDHFLFVNSSVRGPFHRTVSPSPWQDRFLGLLHGRVKLSGSTINDLPARHPYSHRYQLKYPGHAPPYTHVQTPAYAYDREACQILRDIRFYSDDRVYDKEALILEYELRLSQEIKARGWQIASLSGQTSGSGEDCRPLGPNFSAENGDPQFHRGHYGRSFSPYEIVFIKTNRRAYDALEMLSYTYTELASVQEERLRSWPVHDAFREEIHARLKAEYQRRGPGERSVRKASWPGLSRYFSRQ